MTESRDSGRMRPEPEREEPRSFEHGSSGATADAAVSQGLPEDEASTDTPYARRVEPDAAPEADEGKQNGSQT